VELERGPTRIWARVSDDGGGFDLAVTGFNGKGLGMLGMRERAQLAGGRVEITSEPGQGSQVYLEIPLTDTTFGPGPGQPQPKLTEMARSDEVGR